MALLDLSLVTQALVNLIKLRIKDPNIWTPHSVPDVSSLPPDKLTEDAIGIYLYHVSEDAHYKNLPQLGNDSPPVRFTPLALNLFYQLTAHSKTDSLQGVYDEQKMVGLAMKALHDFPIINENTKISNEIIFPIDLNDNYNKIRINLQPIESRDAVTYWTAGSSPLRLAIYYQVSVILLEPEESVKAAARVLQYGVFPFTSGPPRIDGCMNKVSFTLPKTPHETVTVELRPAQVEVGKEALFTGSGFSEGMVKLLLKHKDWPEALEVDPSWIIINKEGVKLTIGNTILTASKTFHILPGIYSIIIKSTKPLKLPDGTIRYIDHLSNECPFAITPSINSFTLNSGVSVTIAGYIFKDPVSGTDLEIEVYVEGQKYQNGTSAGCFSIDAQDKVTIYCNFLTGNYPLRIIINGAESPPYWLVVP